VREGEISLFTPEDDMRLRDRVQSHDRHLKGIADEVEFSSHRTTLELRMLYDCLEGQERNVLAILLEREFVDVDPPLAREVRFPAGTGEDEELGLVRAPDRESSDDEDAPRMHRHNLTSWRSVLCGSPHCGRLAISCLSRRWCEPFGATGSAWNPRTGTSGPCRGGRDHR
jgi:hypothetical protein